MKLFIILSFALFANLSLAGPLDVEGSVLWLDASDLAGDSSDALSFGDNNRWVDKSAAGTAHFEQAQQNRTPEIIEDGLNGMPVIRFDGSVFMDVVEEGKSMLNGVPGATLLGLLNTGRPGGGQTQRVLMISTGAGKPNHGPVLICSTASEPALPGKAILPPRAAGRTAIPISASTAVR